MFIYLRRIHSRPRSTSMLEFIALILGAIALIFGFAADPNITWLIVVGIILLAIRGVWFIFIGDDIDLDIF